MMDLDPRQYDHVTISDNDVRNIVLSYLVHNCFKETAETFISCSGMKQPADYPVDMDKRKPIFHFALEGNSLKAIELTEQLAPDLLEKNKDLHFDLLSLHFVELVSARKCTEALEFAQTKLTPFGNEEKYVEKLEDRMALLAYEEPEKSPMFHLLSSDYRQSVADELNRAILAHANLPSHSSMEMLIRQLTVVTQCLHQELGKFGPHLPSAYMAVPGMRPKPNSPLMPLVIRLLRVKMGREYNNQLPIDYEGEKISNSVVGSS